MQGVQQIRLKTLKCMLLLKQYFSRPDAFSDMQLAVLNTLEIRKIHQKWSKTTNFTALTKLGMK